MTKRALDWTIGLVAIGSVVGLGAMANSGAMPGMPESAAALPVETVRVTPVDSFEERRTFTGVVRAARSSNLGFERTGRLVAVAVDEGDRVEAGQTLAVLDTRNLEARRRELAAQKAAAEAVLEELVAGPRKETIAAAQAEVRDLEAQLKLAERNFSRSEQLVETNAISRELHDERALGLRSVEARLDASQRRLDELLAGTRKEQVEAQRATVARLDAAIEDLEVDLDESRLIAPFAGRVAMRHEDEGTIVAPGSHVVSILEDDQLEAWIGLPADMAATLSDGAVLQAMIGGRAYAAKLRTVLPELDATTRTRTAVFSLADGDGSVVPAQVARVEISSKTELGGYWVPTTALTRASRGLWAVLVVEEDQQRGGSVAASREVEVLHTQDERVLVRGTLQPGDRVITDGTHRLVSGQVVSILK